MNLPRHSEAHALEVAAALAAHLAERLRDDLLLFSGTELHNDLTVILTTAIAAHMERLSGLTLNPSSN